MFHTLVEKMGNQQGSPLAAIPHGAQAGQTVRALDRGPPTEARRGPDLRAGPCQRGRRPAEPPGAGLHGVPAAAGRPRHHRQPDRQQCAGAIEHPDQLELLRAHPELLETTAVEELLRFTSPVADGAARFAMADMEIRGVPIPRGSQVLGSITSANRDEAVFDRPGQLDLTRKPNRHLAFAFGIHYCLGHQLARLEGRIALAALLDASRNGNWPCPGSHCATSPRCPCGG